MPGSPDVAGAGGDTSRADDNFGRVTGCNQAGRARPTTGDMDRPRPVRRPCSPGLALPSARPMVTAGFFARRGKIRSYGKSGVAGAVAEVLRKMPPARRPGLNALAQIAQDAAEG